MTEWDAEAKFVAERAVTYRMAMSMAEDLKVDYCADDVLNIAIFLAGDALTIATEGSDTDDNGAEESPDDSEHEV
jgi:hypothetical protein